LRFKNNKNRIGLWQAGSHMPEIGHNAISSAIHHIASPVFFLNVNGRTGVGREGAFFPEGSSSPPNEAYPVLAFASALHPKNLGDPTFKQVHGLKYAYIAGAMANGITSVEMVRRVGKMGMMGFFGAAGLSLSEIDDAIHQLKQTLDSLPFGFNLIHSPGNYQLELSTVELYLKRGITRVSASAYLNLTLPLIYYRIKGIHTDPDGNIVCPNKIIGKVSRVEVARKFMSPAPQKILSELVAQKMITPEEASLASHVPVAGDITAEADSGGHTDNQPAIALLPTLLALRDEIMGAFNYRRRICVGLAGGIATPASAAAAFAMGAAYVLTGTVNQSCIEAGTSAAVRQMLAEASQADVTMAPAADMFEMGVKVQVLKRGTMFPFRAAKLYDIYSKYDAIDSIPETQRQMLERDFFKTGFDHVWEETATYFRKIDPQQVELANTNSRHKMALIFRSYLGRSSAWAITGEPERKIDYQIWCGPSIGAFNEWARGSFLEKPENRKSVTVAMNLLYGAALITRVNGIQHQGLVFPSGTVGLAPRTVSEIKKLLDE
jgi:PfaD family protein